MINLLPTELKSHYHFAHLNVSLRRWIVGALLGLVGLACLGVFGVLLLNHSINDYQTILDQSNRQLQSADAKSINQQTVDMADNLKLMTQVLSKEVVFSDLLKRLGAVTPRGVTLTGLSISQDDSAINLTAESDTYDAGAQLFTNLNNADNQIFSKADLVSISCPADKAKCDVSVRALVAQDSPFLFINSKGTDL